ncbi:MAG: transposase, partial [Candidatus Cloacimonetes bacterium]|nr:transposase [Candidatus Cloacimonadota bacterium]
MTGETPWYIDHTMKELLTQRIFQIAAGYEDGDDCDDLRGDTVFKMCSNR